MRTRPEHIPPQESVFTGHYEFGQRSDGSRQQVITFGAAHRHNQPRPDYHDYLYDSTLRAWDYIESQVPDMSRLRVLVEGSLRRLPANMFLPEVFDRHSELGLFEVLARRAGVPDENFISPEPGREQLQYLSRVYGAGPVSDYLTIRLIPQWVAMADRPTLPAYILMRMHGDYANTVDPTARDAHEFGYMSLARRWIWQFPNAGPLYKQPASQALSAWAQRETFIDHIETIPPEYHTRVQQVACEFNTIRDQSFLRCIMESVNQGYDVAFCAGDPHLRVIHPDLEELAAM